MIIGGEGGGEGESSKGGGRIGGGGEWSDAIGGGGGGTRQSMSRYPAHSKNSASVVSNSNKSRGLEAISK